MVKSDRQLVDGLARPRHDSLMPRLQFSAAITAVAFSISVCTASACFLANLGSDKKIGDAVENLNKQTRWGRMNDAALMVLPEYRNTFLNQHRLWGTDIQLADSEIVNIQLASDSQAASAFVMYSWYAMTDMTLHETTLRQHWEAKNNGFALSAETVVRGDPSLLAAAD